MDNSQEIEEWRSIEGYEGLYQVSSLGRVRSLDRHVSNGKGIMLLKGKVLKPAKDGGGYLLVNLCKDGKPTMFNVHRLIGMAFQDICGEYVNGHEIDHLNTTRTDNRAENLHWVTRKENMNNPLTRANIYNAQKNRLGNGIIQPKIIIQSDLEGNFIAEYPSQSEAERQTGITQSLISLCCRGKVKTAGGYIFRYKTA